MQDFEEQEPETTEKSAKGGIFSFFNGLTGNKNEVKSPESKISKYTDSIEQSDYLSRDLSWLKFNERVLDQVHKSELNLFD
jgi:polyphosphate kinase